MSKNKGQARGQPSEGQSANTPNGWTYPLAAFINRCGEVRPGEANKRLKDFSKLLLEAGGCWEYIHWLNGSAEAPPPKPTREVEVAAVEAVLSGFKRVYDNPSEPSLLPDQLNELSEYRSRAIRAAEDRLRQLKGGQDDGPYMPNGLRYGGKDVEMATIPHRLLSALWGKETARADEIIEQVWGHGESDNAIKSALQRANRALEEVGVPWSYGRKSGYFVKN